MPPRRRHLRHPSRNVVTRMVDNRLDTTSAQPQSRYEQLLTSPAGTPTDLAARFAAASATARSQIPATTDREIALATVAAGVAAPALVGYVAWLLDQARHLGLTRLCFLSRDAQIFYEIAQSFTARLHLDLDLRYVYSSRRTWSLAAADPQHLDQQDWLFNSFMRSNAADVCARLGIPMSACTELLKAVGASLDPNIRADDPRQAVALRRFVAHPRIADMVAPRITRMHALVREYASQEEITSTTTGIVDAGWTGRMIGALTSITDGLPQPAVFFFAHEPRATGWTDPDRLHSYMYDTGSGDGIDLRVPDTPYIIETFCMSDHGILADYTRDKTDRIVSVTESATNPSVMAWGFDTYRSTIRAFCDALNTQDLHEAMTADLRPAIATVLSAFWMTPNYAEAATWGDYPYDSDPLARATRPLASPFDEAELTALIQGIPLEQRDRAWLQGSLALSGALGLTAAKLLKSCYQSLGAPPID